MNRILWIAQWILALVFLFAGTVKLVTPIQPMAEQSGVPAGLLLFVGVMEICGGVGLILPGLLGIRPQLMAIAAAGLVVIMIGAVTVTLRTGPALLALIPLATGLIAAFVAYGRWRLAPPV
jgi:DoxX-like family